MKIHEEFIKPFYFLFLFIFILLLFYINVYSNNDMKFINQFPNKTCKKKKNKYNIVKKKEDQTNK